LMQRLYTQASWLAFVPVVGATLGVAISGPALLDVVGHEYRDAYWPIVILMLAATCNAANGLTSNLYLMSGREGLVVRVSAVQALGMSALVAGLAYSLGPVGAAVGVAVPWIVGDAFLVARLRGVAGLEPAIWSRSQVSALHRSLRRPRRTLDRVPAS
jgi:O-antigen/teichoic acid export membrane protein